MCNTSYGSKLVFSNKILHFKETNNYILNKLCSFRFTDFKTYRKKVKKILNIKSKTPIYINENILLIPIYSYQKYENIWINYFKISKINHIDSSIVIRFYSGKIVKIKISKYVWQNQIRKANKLIEYFKTLSYNLL